MLRVVLATARGSTERWPSDTFVEEMTVCAECGALFVPPDQIEEVAARASERILRDRQQQVPRTEHESTASVGPWKRR